MNFIQAIQHATIGYQMRRKVWSSDCRLRLYDNGELHWCAGIGVEIPVKLLGEDRTFDLTDEDIQATDWETT